MVDSFDVWQKYIYIYILLEPNIKDTGGNINLIYSQQE